MTETVLVVAAAKVGVAKKMKVLVDDNVGVDVAAKMKTVLVAAAAMTDVVMWMKVLVGVVVGVDVA
jgi:hypothetical protein